MTKYLLTAAIMLGFAIPAGLAQAEQDEWIKLFDGETFTGWKANENQSTWKIDNGAFVCNGPRSHLFYLGEAQPLKNFEFQADVKTLPGSNSGIYIHTKWQDEGWPAVGYEAQVNASHKDPRKTGSIYAVKDVLKPPHADDKWFKYTIIVQGDTITVKIDDKVVNRYTEKAEDIEGERRLSQGTFALQGHDPDSTVFFKNIRVRRLPDSK